ncbi:MAG: MBOAT family protein [Eubacterium sp.]|nr:MBOAT family protein [Eubacterium sp.]
MVFSSLTFLCVFMPLVYLLHLILPDIRAKNGLLIAASLIFYAYGEPVYVLLMIFSVFINYLAALAMSAGRLKKFCLSFIIIVNLGILCVFKYTGFLIGLINNLLKTGIHDPEIALPIGISFFTFQAMSYVIDVYKGKVEVQKNFFKVFLYISFFPQLIAGPIVKYHDIAYAIDHRVLNLDDTVRGLRRFIFGLSKKILIANTMALAADHIFSADRLQIGMPTAWIGAIAYMLQIYYDFSGYSDMAIGLGIMFGFRFKENFDYPYISGTIREFWRRWHISLSSWFKEYVYIPLGGNRKGRARTVLNKMIVFFLTGLWHGANWTFVVWGLYHGTFLLLEEYIPAIRKIPRALGHLYVCIVVCVGFVIFRADSLAQGLFMIKNMFLFQPVTASVSSLALQQMTPWFILMSIIAIVGAGCIQSAIEKDRISRHGYLLNTVSLILLCLCIIQLSGNSYNPFIYFRF